MSDQSQVVAAYEALTILRGALADFDARNPGGTHAAFGAARFPAALDNVNGRSRYADAVGRQQDALTALLAGRVCRLPSGQFLGTARDAAGNTTLVEMSEVL